MPIMQTKSVNDYLRLAAGAPAVYAAVPIPIAAQHLGRTENTVRTMLRDGRLSGVEIPDAAGKKVTLVTIASLLAYTDKQERTMTRSIETVRTILLQDPRLHTYREIMEPIGLDHHRSSDRDMISRVLAGVSRQSYDDDWLMLSVLVVAKDTNRPSPGFFALARELTLQRDDESDEQFFRRHCAEVLAHYGKGKR
jgi:hypothetical protein